VEANTTSGYLYLEIISITSLQNIKENCLGLFVPKTIILVLVKLTLRFHWSQYDLILCIVSCNCSWLSASKTVSSAYSSISIFRYVSDSVSKLKSVLTLGFGFVQEKIQDRLSRGKKGSEINVLLAWPLWCTERMWTSYGFRQRHKTWSFYIQWYHTTSRAPAKKIHLGLFCWKNSSLKR